MQIKLQIKNIYALIVDRVYVILNDLIRILSYFDSEKSLWMVDQANKKYLELIKEPMDFVTIYKRNEQGHYIKC